MASQVLDWVLGTSLSHATGVTVNSTYPSLDLMLYSTPGGLMEYGGTAGQLHPNHRDQA